MDSFSRISNGTFTSKISKLNPLTSSIFCGIAEINSIEFENKKHPINPKIKTFFIKTDFVKKSHYKNI
jgi:hypothetical protein